MTNLSHTASADARADPRTEHNRPSWVQDGAILLALLLFLGLSVHQLELPGLNYDEAFDVVPAMQLLLGQPLELLRGSGLQIAGRWFPLMVMDYKGVVHTYWTLPFLGAIGVNVLALRLSCLFLGSLTVTFTHRFTRELYGHRAAAATALLLAVSPPFVFWSRQGVLWTTVMLTCGMGCLAALAAWRRKGGPWRLHAAAFLLGLGLSAKLAFLWFPLALLGSTTVLGLGGLRAVQQSRRGETRRARSHRAGRVIGQITLAVLALLLGLFPLLLYNLQTEGTVTVIVENLKTSYYGVDNLAYLANLELRLNHLRGLLEGSGFWYLGAVHRDTLFPIAFWAAVPLILAGSVFCARAGRLRLFAPLMMLLMVLQSGATVSGLWPEHYLLLLPFPQIVVALGLDALCELAGRVRVVTRGSRVCGVLFVLALSSIAASQLRVDVLYHQALARSGGSAAHSDANYELARYLEGQDQSVVAMDWGIKTTVQFLTQGRVNPVERFGFQDPTAPAADFAVGLASHLDDPATIYVFHTTGFTIFQGRWEAFEALARGRGLSLNTVHVIQERSGQPLFLVAEVADQD